MMKEQYLKVEDKDHLYRDVTNNAIVNSDYQSYKNYEELYRKKYMEKRRLEFLEEDVNNIKSDLKEIKELLRNLSK